MAPYVIITKKTDIYSAIARVSGTVDTILSVADRSTQQVLDTVSDMARDRAVENGAIRDTVELAEIDVIPVQVGSLQTSRVY